MCIRDSTHSVGAQLAGLLLVIGVLHAFCEVLVVLPFYLNGSMPQANYEKGFFVSIFLLVGVGSVIHSMVDMCISIWLYKPISSVYDLSLIHI